MSEPITIIGAKTAVSGNMEGDEDVTISGRFDGTINISKTLTINVDGAVRANIKVRKAVINGVLAGNLEASDSVHITEHGRVTGDIVAPRVIMAEGASFLGNIHMGDLEADHVDSATSPSKAAFIPKPAPAKTKPAEYARKKAPKPQVRSVGKAKAVRRNNF